MKKLILLFTTLCIIVCCKKDDDNTNTPPEAFNLIGVTNNAIDVDVLPSFSWEEAIDLDGDTVTYNLYLDTNENPTSLYAENINTTNFEITESLNTSETYYWKVEAIDKEGETTTSNIYMFTTRDLNFSSNGIVTANAGFSARYHHGSFVFNDKLWVIGGRSNGVDKNDIWYSTDGITWVEVITNTPFDITSNFSPIVFNNKIWIIGTNGIWYSSDGIDWIKTNAIVPFNHSTCIVFNDKIWVIVRDETWYSSDGENWTKIINNTPFNKLRHTSVVYNDKIWVIGGDSGVTSSNDVWFSSDGITWGKATDNANFSDRVSHTSVVFQGKIWVIGGHSNNGTDYGVSFGDIWYSNDGTNWTLANDAVFSERRRHASVIFKNKLWIIGGTSESLSSDSLNDVWAFD